MSINKPYVYGLWFYKQSLIYAMRHSNYFSLFWNNPLSGCYINFDVQTYTDYIDLKDYIIQSEMPKCILLAEWRMLYEDALHVSAKNT